MATLTWYLLELSLMLASGALPSSPVQERLKSGPAVGERLGYFHPLYLNGDQAGKRVSITQDVPKLYRYPMCLVFLSDTSERTMILVKRLDAEAAKSKEAFRLAVVVLSEEITTGELGVFVYADKAKTLAALEKLRDDAKLQATTFAVHASPGPKGYAIAKEAAVTIVLWNQNTVRATLAFRKDELREKEIDGAVEQARKLKMDK